MRFGSFRHQCCSRVDLDHLKRRCFALLPEIESPINSLAEILKKREKIYSQVERSQPITSIVATPIFHHPRF